MYKFFIAALAGVLSVGAFAAVQIRLTVSHDAIVVPPVITEPPVIVPPVQPPIEPPVQPPSGYTKLAPLVPVSSRYADYYQPAYNTPADGWRMITEMCGPVGSWEHEIEVQYGAAGPPEILARNMTGCVHVKGILGPNGEKPRANVYATKGYTGTLIDGGVFLENLSTNGIGSPNDKHFLVAHNLDVSDWNGHALITSSNALHLYVEVLDSTFSKGNSQHALYIDNNAFANIQRNKIESPGLGHALRSIAQKAVILDNEICNIQCDGAIVTNNAGTPIVGSPPVDIYVNGSTLFENNRVVYHRKGPNSAYHAATFRRRPAITSLSRRLDGDHYRPLTWGTPEYNDSDSWTFPPIETVVKDMKIDCSGAPPCRGWLLESAYPYGTISTATRLLLWWRENKFQDWDSLIANADPTWHETLNLMTPSYRVSKLENTGLGLGSSPFPLAVPMGWGQKSKITFENVTGDIEKIYYSAPRTSGWCEGGVSGDVCADPNKYSLPTVEVVQ